jgi:hypothetical protein
VTPGEAPVTAEFGERILGRFSFLASLGQFEEGPLLVLLERRYGVEGRLGSLVDDGCQPEPFGPDPISGAGGGRTR